MFELLLAVMVVAIVAIGVRIFLKFREISGWKPDEDPVKKKRFSPLPKDLRELNIENPSENFDGISDEGNIQHSGYDNTGTKTKV